MSPRPRNLTSSTSRRPIPRRTPASSSDAAVERSLHRCGRSGGASWAEEAPPPTTRRSIPQSLKKKTQEERVCPSSAGRAWPCPPFPEPLLPPRRCAPIERTAAAQRPPLVVPGPRLRHPARCALDSPQCQIQSRAGFHHTKSRAGGGRGVRGKLTFPFFEAAVTPARTHDRTGR